MKISKTVLAVVGIGVVVIAGITLGMALNQQNAEKLRVETDLNLAKKRLNALDNDKLLAQKEQLTLQIDNYTAMTAGVKTKISFSLDNIDITDKLIKDAEDCGVDILEIVSPGLSSENVGEIGYDSMNMNVKARGVSEDAARFVYSLKEVFPTSVVKSVTLEIIKPDDIPTPPTLNTSGDNSTTVVSLVITQAPGLLKDTVVDINLVIYSYKGN